MINEEENFSEEMGTEDMVQESSQKPSNSEILKNLSEENQKLKEQLNSLLIMKEMENESNYRIQSLMKIEKLNQTLEKMNKNLIGIGKILGTRK